MLIKDKPTAMNKLAIAVELDQLLIKAKEFYRQGLLQDVKTYCEKILALDPQNFEALLVLGTAAMNLKHYEAAKHIFIDALKIDQSNPGAYNNMGNILQHFREHESALEHYNKAIALQANYPEAYNNRGITLTDLNEYDAAIESYQTALKLKPGYVEAHNNFGYAYFLTKQYEKALAEYDLAIQLCPGYAMAHKNRGNALHKLNQNTLALNAHNQAILLEPSSFVFWQNKAELLKDIGEKDQALDCIKTSIAIKFNGIKQQQAILKKMPIQGMPIEDAANALLDLKELFDKHQINFFLAYGTLLGIYRDGEMMSYDKDLDVGLFDENDRDQIFSTVDKSDKFEIHNFELHNAETKRYCFGIKHLQTGALIDLFFFVPDGEFFLSGFHQLPSPLLWRFSIFNLSNIKYRGKNFQIPSDPEKFLVDIYGPDWRIPDPYFDSVVSGHNLVASTRSTSLLFGLFRLLNRLEDSNWKKAFGYCKQIFEYEKEPWLEEISNWLAIQIEKNALAQTKAFEPAT
jgi:tetratricopeptide (TPR) repeat protein